MTSQAVYSRLLTETHEALKAHAETTGQSVSAAVEDLVQRGLKQLSSEGLSESLEKDLAQSRAKILELEKELAKLKGSLEVCKAKESIALAAQAQAAALQEEKETNKRQIDQLRNCLMTPVAKCRNCHTELRLFDIGQRRCARCGVWSLDWLPEYTVPATTWEVVRDGAAVVGVTAVVVALLNALGSGQKQT